MLTYNFTRVFKARGIDRPYDYLKKAGFSSNFASKINRNEAKRVELRELEKLCVVLRCTPNDVVEWEPDTEEMIDEEHPMNIIRKPEKEVDLTKTLNQIPLGQLREIEDLIHERINQSKGRNA